MLILTLFFKSKNQGIKASIILFLVPFAVISNTFFVTTGVFAERWWYFPSIGLVLFTLALLGKLPDHKIYKLLIPIFILIAGVFYLFVSFGQARIWTDERKLVVSAAERSPNSAWARANLAAVYFKEKDFSLAKNEVERSLEIYENYPFALNIYAKLKWREGKLNESESAFLSAAGSDLNKRNNRDLYRALAVLKLEEKNYGAALNYIQRAAESAAFGDIEKAIFLDNLLFDYIKSLAENSPNKLSDSEKKTVDALATHIKGF